MKVSILPRTRSITLPLMSALLALAAPTALASAQTAPSAASFEVDETHGVMVTMRDGVRLSVDIYQPRSASRKPAILSMTCYDNTLEGTRNEARWFAQRGYVVVLADVRGRYDSEGSFDPFDARHKTDGYDLVEWIASQPWATGKVGMIGASFLGWTQWWTASTAPPHLAAIAPKVAPPDAFANAPYQNGVLTGGWLVDWGAMMAGKTAQVVGPGPYSGWGQRRDDLKHTPYADINDYRGMASGQYFRKWYENNLSTARYWTDISYQTPESYSRISVPSLSFTGWFDANHPGSTINYTGMKTFGATPSARRPFMVIGPWDHRGPSMVGDNSHQRILAGIDYGPDAKLDTATLILRWFDRYLKEVDNGIDKEDPVRVFVMGENKWRFEKDWPLPGTRFTKFFLEASGQSPNSPQPGKVTASLSKASVCDEYTYDPRNPTPDASSLYEPSNGHIPGAVDTRASSKVGTLVYETPVLRDAVEVVGPIEAVIYASTSARDTDWFVRLVDVQPDGRALLLAEGALRARSRDESRGGAFNSAKLSSIEPGKVLPYRIEFWRDTANLFKQGHKIRVEISSSWAPYFLPNLNTGDDNLAFATMDHAQIARQRICTGARTPSHLLLPIIPAPRKS